MDWTLGNINNPRLIVLLVYTYKLVVKGRVHYSLMSVINGLEQACNVTHLENGACTTVCSKWLYTT